MNARLTYFVDDAGPRLGFQHIESAQMPESHPSLPTSGHRLLGNVVAGEPRRIITGVGMEIEPHTSDLSQVEEPIDVTTLILVHIGTTTQDGETHLQTLTQQSLGYVIVKNT